MRFRTRLLLACALVISFVSLKLVVPSTRTEDGVVATAELDGMGWTALASKRILFVHQSVGQNIVDGLRGIAAEAGDPLVFIESPRNGPGFENARVGINGNPLAKLRAFETLIDTAEPYDIALMKFCYLDLTHGTDPAALFSEYRSAIAELQLRNPDTEFVHVTVPIEAAPPGFGGRAKEIAKALLRRPLVVDDNLIRQRYNDLMRTEYAGRATVFDLARSESRRADGARPYRMVGDERVYLMNPLYTDDGGHLNEAGRRQIASELILTLNGLVDRAP